MVGFLRIRTDAIRSIPRVRKVMMRPASGMLQTSTMINQPMTVRVRYMPYL